jgi:hypothetical protein
VTNVQSLLEKQEAAIVDLTREDSLSCYEIDQLAISDNGYSNWIKFLLEFSDGPTRLYPSLIVNPASDDTELEYYSDLRSQLKSIIENFPGACYRASVLADTEFLYDLRALQTEINDAIELGRKFIVVLDHEFIRPSTGTIHAVRTSGLIEGIFELIPGCNIVVMATSFPRSVEDIGNADHDNFPIEERYLFDQVKRNVSNSNHQVTYGDYGSINPERGDNTPMTGWRPRIDFPTSNRRTYYYREKRNMIGRDGNNKPIYDDYESHYQSVAEKVTRDGQFEKIPSSWGCAQIEAAAGGAVPGKNPSFWISVRMEIHIQQMVRNIRSLMSDKISA